MAQWSGLCAFTAGAQVSPLVTELRYRKQRCWGKKGLTVSRYKSISCSVVSYCLQPHGPGSTVHGMGCHSLLQGIFLTQGSNLGLLYYRWILYGLNCDKLQKTISLHSFLLSTNEPLTVKHTCIDTIVNVKLSFLCEMD